MTNNIQPYRSSYGCLAWIIVIAALIWVGCVSCASTKEGCVRKSIETKKFNK